jgi:membrane protein
MNLPLFLARKIYSTQKNKEHISRPAINIATAGVAIGIIIMTLSLCVVLGFKQTVKNKVIGFGGDIQVTNFITLQTSESYPIQASDSIIKVIQKTNGVKHVQRYAFKQGILKTDNDFLGVTFKGVDQSFDSTFIANNLVSGRIPHFSNKENTKELLISKSIANRLKVNTGDKIYAYFVDQSGIRVRPFLIAGIYETNLSQYDKIICFTDLHNIIKLNNWESDQVTGIEIALKDFNQLDDIQANLANKINKTVDSYGGTYATASIKEITPQIFSWLDLLDLNIWIILILMILVASITMISGLLIIILERTNMIGLLKAMGARTILIRKSFLWFAVFVIGKGLLIGNIVSIVLLLVQRYTGIVTLDANTYYVKAVPVEINIPILLLLNVATIIISTAVLIVPSYLIAHIHPAKAMRYE